MAEAALGEMIRQVDVLLPLPLNHPYSYLVPNGMQLSRGQFVKVPLGNRQLRGCVWSDPDRLPGRRAAKMPGQNNKDGLTLDLGLDPDAGADPKVDPGSVLCPGLPRLKPIEHVYDVPPLTPTMMAFIDWVSAYTLSAPGAVLRLVKRAGAELEPPPRRKIWSAPAVMPVGLATSPGRKRLLDNLPDKPGSIAEIARAAGVSPAIVRGLAKSGGLISQYEATDPPFERPDFDRRGPELSQDQAEAAQALCAAVAARGYSCQLLDGVTGAGKTEIYLEAVAQALRQDSGAQCLMLLPEIALTLPFLERIAVRFGAQAAPWHSDMGAAARRRVWRRVLDGTARLVIGARSALFLPFQNLRLIIVDEEHEAAYKQSEGVMYHARDMAVARAARGDFPVILVSATPSLETLINIEEGRYGHIRLESRYGRAALPEIHLLDLRKTPPPPGQWLAPPLVAQVTRTIAEERQALLFVNRRGYAPLTICRKCGERLMAPHSDTWLVEHRAARRLVCHHTGYSIPTPDICPHCESTGSLAACGPGVERIAEEARHHWPAARLEIFSSDMIATPSAAQALLARMKAREIDILVATQMVAKGHHFPNLTCVGIVDADLGLSGGDLRAAERSYQLLTQVAGRAGRADFVGKVFVQSWQPHNPVIQSLAAGDRDRFMQAEIAGRRELGFPPFGRLASLLLSSENEARLNEAAQMLAQSVLQQADIEVWGPAPAALYRLRGRYRIRFLVKADRGLSIQRYVTDWLSQVKLPSAVRHIVDIDPYHFG